MQTALLAPPEAGPLSARHVLDRAAAAGFIARFVGIEIDLGGFGWPLGMMHLAQYPSNSSTFKERRTGRCRGQTLATTGYKKLE